NRLHEPVHPERTEHLGNRTGWIPQGCNLIANCGNDGTRLEIEQIIDEFVWMHCLDVIRGERIGWEILEVEGDNALGAGSDGCRQHVAVIWIREHQTINERFVSR